jgi:toxin HigB-1
MDADFDSDDLDRLETDPAFTGGFGPEIVRGFRKAMQAIRAAHDERDLYALRGLRFEKLKGNRSHQHSLRINQQWRLVVELRGAGKQKRVGIVGIEDYH